MPRRKIHFDKFPCNTNLKITFLKIAKKPDENKLSYLSLNYSVLSESESVTEKKKKRHREEMNQDNITSQQPEGKTHIYIRHSHPTCVVAQ